MIFGCEKRSVRGCSVPVAGVGSVDPRLQISALFNITPTLPSFVAIPRLSRFENLLRELNFSM